MASQEVHDRQGRSPEQAAANEEVAVLGCFWFVALLAFTALYLLGRLL